MFSRIRDHEEIAERGEDPVTVLKARRTGTFEDEDGRTVGTGSSGTAGSGRAERGEGAGAAEAVEGEFVAFCAGEKRRFAYLSGFRPSHNG